MVIHAQVHGSVVIPSITPAFPYDEQRRRFLSPRLSRVEAYDREGGYCACQGGSSLVVGTWIESFADTVTEEVEAEDGEEDGHAGEESHPPRRRQVGLGLIEHRAPARLSGLGPEPQVRQGGFGDDGVAHRERRLHQERRQRVRQDVPDHYPEVARADGARRLYVVQAADGEHLRARDPDESRHEPDTYGDHREAQTPSEDRRYHESQDQEREGLDAVHDSHDDPLVPEAPEVPADEAHRQPNEEGKADRDQGRLDRDPRPVDHAGEDVAAQ